MSQHNGSTPAVTLAPVPTAVQVGQVSRIDGTLMVVLVVTTPVGPLTYFLGGANAVGVGREMVRVGELTMAGLLLPELS